MHLNGVAVFSINGGERAMGEEQEKYMKPWHRTTQSSRRCLFCLLLILASFFYLIDIYALVSRFKTKAERIQWDPRLPAKAAFVVMAREEELHDIRATMKDLEDRFNGDHGYPWVFLSEKRLSPRFQQWVRAVTRHPVYFGQIPPEQWNEPSWIDTKRVEEAALQAFARGVFHGQSISWRKVTRFGLF